MNEIIVDISDRPTDDYVDVEFSELCSDAIGGSFEFDAFGENEPMWIEGGEIKTVA